MKFDLYRMKRTYAAVLAALGEYSVQQAVSDGIMDADYAHTCEDGPAPLARWRYYPSAVLLVANVRVRGAICAVRGHSMEDTGSYANPESGADDLTCKRCGFHIHHTYY